MGILENDLLSEYISKRFGIRQVLIFWAFTLGVLGSLLIFMIPFFSILEFLFPSIGFSRLPPIEGWLWQFIAIVVVLIWLFHIKNPEKLAAYIRPLDRWRYRFLSLSFIPITILFYEKYPIEGYLAWKSLLIECIPWILLSFVSSVMPIGLKQLAQQLQNNIESSPLPVKKSKQKKTTTP